MILLINNKSRNETKYNATLTLSALVILDLKYRSNILISSLFRT